MNIYQGLLFLDGFRVPAEHTGDQEKIPAPPEANPVAAAPASAWRRTLRGIATFAGVATPPGAAGGCG